ncbi:hypothetical protein B0F90DRAFT_1810525 [Multifurca ochricompacta]|uniref:PIPK domain-containing protein n=1 Tax=Multifurca ochricompacta TaxID=376703 RepID=A0AAD4QLS2_9AGAM|nr:hypothetical protein B0F90DRAFT_1810525 [Multifurca ochricompacta]
MAGALRHNSSFLAIPVRATLRKTLTIESSNHLHQFLGHLLEEETSYRGADKDAWVSSIEGALNDLATEVDAGAWLAGIRRARVAKRKCEEQAVAEDWKQEQERLAKEKETEGRNKTRHRVPAVPDTEKQAREVDPTPPEARVKAELPHTRKTPSDDANRNLRALRQLRGLANRRRTSFSNDLQHAYHLLLTVALFDTSPARSFSTATAGDTTAHRCTFSSGIYSLPPPDLFGEDPDDNSEAVVNGALYGFKEWDVNFPETHEDIELVGGTFSLSKGRTPDEHASLVRILRVSIYVLFSLLLEQHFLSSSSIRLHYPMPPLPPILPPSPTVPIVHRNSSPDVHIEVRQRRRDLLRQGIWSLIHKHLHRSVTVNTPETRGVSLDLTLREPEVFKPRSSLDVTPPSQPRQRRFSLFGESRAPQSSPVEPQSSPDRPFQTALRLVEEGRALLSASTGLVISPPRLLTRLSELEKANPTRRLTGEERTGLTSILGWEGKKAAARGSMTGMIGFLRQQQISLLYSEHVHNPDRKSQGSADETLTKLVEADPKSHVHCGVRVRWITYTYYAGGDCDQSLGDLITSMCVQAEEPCSQPGCKGLRWQHERRWIHNGVRMAAKMEAQGPSASPNIHSEEIEIWQSCKTCGESTAQCKMTDGTYLFSFAKFLELLLYSSSICNLSHPPCTHMSASSPSTPLPASRFNIIRHFSYKSYRVSFTLSPIDDIFELQLPRLQFTKGDGAVDDTDTEKKELRQEIKHWWQAVAEHLDKVEAEFAGGGPLYHKSLPRLPSVDDAWETPSEEMPTPKVFIPMSLPPTPIHTAEPSLSSLSTVTPTDSGSDPSSKTTVPSDGLSDSAMSLRLLTNMRFTFQRAEQALYSQLRDTPNATLNNVRREFHSAAHGASRRLAAWEAKHVSKDARPHLAAERDAIQEPRWWHSGYHAVPGGNVIVQEEDWGSIIAFTLSSLDYQRELASMSNPRASQASPPPPPVQPHITPRQATLSSLNRSSASASTSSFKFFGTSNKPDPDREDSVWHEPEACSAVVSRKEHPRDPTALMSLREVLRHRVSVDAAQGAPSSVFTSASRAFNSVAPPSAWAKPAVEVNMAAVDGQVTGLPEAVVTAGRILHELDGASVTSSKGSTDSRNSAFVETNVHRGKTSSVISRTSAESDGTVGPIHPIPEDVVSPKPHLATAEQAHATSTVSTMQDAVEQGGHDGSLFSWTSSLTNAMRYMLKAELPSRLGSPAMKNHHGLLSTDPLAIDERPHIKYDWTIGKRLRFSCTVYYAKQFDALRRRCGVGDLFLKSMEKCERWKAVGGKSRSNFWKTSDDRFITKTLVNAWNVADLQVLIDLAPLYFLHMESTANRASILAKLLGFYTIEVRNLETGTVQAKADLLVMENLFYGQKPSKTFDLKGIQGRKVKPNSNSSASKTLFDSEWIEGQQRALTLVNPVSKVILQERSNIMDYSLLLGVDEEKKQIHCGLVDTIGSYTFAKTLEYKAKGLSGKEEKDITVIPPQEYQERFVSALDNYFMACPDKWTKPLDEKKLIYDPALLPSVL